MNRKATLRPTPHDPAAPGGPLDWLLGIYTNDRPVPHALRRLTPRPRLSVLEGGGPPLPAGRRVATPCFRARRA